MSTNGSQKNLQKNLIWIPKIVLLSPTSMSTQQEDKALTTKQPLAVQKKKNVGLETKKTKNESKPIAIGENKQGDMAKETAHTGL